MTDNRDDLLRRAQKLQLRLKAANAELVAATARLGYLITELSQTNPEGSVRHMSDLVNRVEAFGSTIRSIGEQVQREVEE